MTEWGVIPSIRVRDMAEALAFYRGPLEFTLVSGGDDATNSSLSRGDAHVMIETAADHYGDEYNAAIRDLASGPRRVSPSTWKPQISPRSTPGSKQAEHGSSIRSPNDRGVKRSSPWRITRGAG